MQLMCDAVAVLGSRHGLLFHPMAKRCEIVRFDRFEAMPHLALQAGMIVGGRKFLLPLCPEGGNFAFYDQRLTPCTMSILGIAPDSGIQLELTVVTPFRPRDPAFSTTPALGLRLAASRIQGNFRWTKRTEEPAEITLFLQFGGEAVSVETSGSDALDLTFQSVRTSTEGDCFSGALPLTEPLAQRDRLVALSGRRKGKRFVRSVSLAEGAGAALEVAWCSFSEPVLSVRGERCPFRYAANFRDLDAVADWARENRAELFDNAARVDGIVARNNLPRSVNRLLAYTLHSWLLDTWWATRNGRDWFSVWEGSCYYHSTVDVEFTQAPFYLSVWPELLGFELDQWPEYSKDGAATLGGKGQGTLFLSHDVGSHASASGQRYHHEMEVEETANYLILSYAWYRRTGDASKIRAHAATIEKFLAFLEAADTRGTGIPDKGVANTIDDASPALQYGRAQVYIAVKALAAFETGAEMLKLLGKSGRALECATRAQRIRTMIEEKGWLGDHFATLLEKGGEGLHVAWTGEELALEEVPGWDAAHIYTVNGMAPLDMTGFDLGLDRKKIVRDLQVATARCLREYGCVHTDFDPRNLRAIEALRSLADTVPNCGWISMNMLRDIAAFYRGVDLRHLAGRYWEWQVTANTQEPKMFFETFKGNNLCFYPRGVAVWGYFDALAGLVVDAVTGIDRAARPFPQVVVPKLSDADWKTGECPVIGGPG